MRSTSSFVAGNIMSSWVTGRCTSIGRSSSKKPENSYVPAETSIIFLWPISCSVGGILLWMLESVITLYLFFSNRNRVRLSCWNLQFQSEGGNKFDHTACATHRVHKRGIERWKVGWMDCWWEWGRNRLDITKVRSDCMVSMGITTPFCLRFSSTIQ